MRSTLLLAALAAGAVNAFEKDVYVTDWTTVTVTKTVTAAAVTYTVPAVQQVQVESQTSTVAPTVTHTVPAVQQSQVEHQTSTVAPPPVETTHSELSLSKKTTFAPDSVTLPALQLPTQVPEPQTSTESTSYFSTAWTSTLEPASSTLATSTSSASATSTPVNAYQQAVLYNHNIHRSNHSAPSVDWSANLEKSARALAAKCVYEHDTSIDGGGYGQNIGYGVTENEIGMMITNLMYNDEIDYFPNPYGVPNPAMTEFEKWGHFSQIVWKDTTHVGCATVMCNGLGNIDSSSSLPFTVCNYSPPGNYNGEYADNVLAPLGRPSYSA